MSDLTDGLLALASLSRADLRLEPVDLAALAQVRRWHACREQQPERPVDVVVADSLPARGDPVLLGQLMGNLVANAWKFTSRNAHARIEVGGTQSATGSGSTSCATTVRASTWPMPAKMFEAFRRMHSAAPNSRARASAWRSPTASSRGTAGGSGPTPRPGGARCSSFHARRRALGAVRPGRRRPRWPSVGPRWARAGAPGRALRSAASTEYTEMSSDAWLATKASSPEASNAIDFGRSPATTEGTTPRSRRRRDTSRCRRRPRWRRTRNVRRVHGDGCRSAPAAIASPMGVNVPLTGSAAKAETLFDTQARHIHEPPGPHRSPRTPARTRRTAARRD